MPVMDGLEVLQRVKQTNPDLPVIVVTAHATVDVSICLKKLVVLLRTWPSRRVSLKNYGLR
jgi:CheY-like chemotaxis protein